MKKQLAAAGVVSLMASAAFAKYGMAGCGIGSLVFEDQPGKIQILAVTTNEVIVPQTSAITTGTSNCFEEGSMAASDRYIETNQLALQKDIARGEGETLSGLLMIWQCEDPSKAGSALQKNFDRIYNQSGQKPSEVRGNMTEIMKTESISCKGMA